MNGSEVELVRRARAGDQAAFEALFRHYQLAMYRLALRFSGSEETAADVTQDAFVKAWEQLPRLRDEAAFGGWLRAILLNAARDAHRRREAAGSLQDDPRGGENVADESPGPGDGLALGYLEQAVRRAVLSLPEHQRTVVVMHHLEGMLVDDIAATLGLRKGTVLSRLSRGRDMLRKKLAGRLEVD